MQTVIVIEDDEMVVGLYKSLCDDRKYSGLVEFHFFSNKADAWNFFEHCSVMMIASIVVDGHVEDGETIDLVKKFRQSGYRGLIIGSSSDMELAEDLIDAGCNQSLNKFEAMKLALRQVIPED